MNVWNGIERFRRTCPAVVATIGNFDGVHRRTPGDPAARGRERRARQRHARRSSSRFDPHPLAVVAPERTPAAAADAAAEARRA